MLKKEKKKTSATVRKTSKTEITELGAKDYTSKYTCTKMFVNITTVDV